MEKKHWLIFGFLFLALWIPRLGFFSADAANICDVTTKASPAHNHDSTTGTAAILDSTTGTATILDPQMQVGHCGTLMAVMEYFSPGTNPIEPKIQPTARGRKDIAIKI
jgi:hypothetical protein